MTSPKHEELDDRIPPEIQDEETEASPLSPSELLDKAMNIMPGRELMPYLSTIIYLRKYKDYSWRGISSWLSENGNVKSSHTTVCNFYKYVTEENLSPEDEIFVRTCFEEVDIKIHTGA